MKKKQKRKKEIIKGIRTTSLLSIFLEADDRKEQEKEKKKVISHLTHSLKKNCDHKIHTPLTPRNLPHHTTGPLHMEAHTSFSHTQKT